MNKKKIYPWYFVVAPLLLYVALFVLPSLIGVGYSFTDWSSYSDKISFVGWENFADVFSPKRDYLAAILNTLWFTVASTVIKTVLALLFAVLLSKGVRALNLHRAILYLPAVLSVLIVGIVFTSILDPSIGLMNEALRAVGLEGLAQRWLVDPDLAMWSVIGVDVWRGMGYIMAILLVGILSISPTYNEAAELDGASAWQRFRHVTLPLLRPTLAVVIVLNVLYGLKVFDIVYVLTNGGPGHRTEVLYTAVFQEFSSGRYAEGAALSTVMLVIMSMVGVFMIRTLTRNEVQE
ncbi:carbohydrate ABC transporter permease [Microbispora sp. NPDC049125]|uniref:carbohydrate ABC transporter permease n=1 Tax=Microbispora sp. NPDC049125 TaxID=3154929 RepID=UPI0034660795